MTVEPWSSLYNIVLNVVASFVFAGVVSLLQKKGKKPLLPITHPPAINTQLETTPLDHRQQNRIVAEAVTYRFLFHLITFGVLYLSITMPPLFKALFFQKPLLLNQARFIGAYLPAIPIGKSYLQITFFIVAAVIYLPLLAVAENITSLIFPIVDAFKTVTNRLWSTITMLVFFIFCLPIAATSISLFYPKSFFESLSIVFILLFLIVMFNLSQDHK